MSSVLLIPAIDIKDGQCVRLNQGRMDEATHYGDDPVAMADRWVAAGARRLHVVDLDGAVQGHPVHFELIRTLVRKHRGIPIQIGGGLRSMETVADYLDAGVEYVVIGTRAITAPHFVTELCQQFPGHIMVGLDAREGRVATDGWVNQSSHRVVDVARRFQDQGVAAIIFTDIGRDGMLNRVNIEAIVDLCQGISIPVIASGGLCSFEDVHALCQAAALGVQGGIVGRALYSGDLDFPSAQRLADHLGSADATR